MVKWGHIIYGGVNSADYGIYITGEAVYNAPERDIEFIEVPGRNGAIAMDNGRYRNISVTYPAGAFGGSQKEFRDKLTKFRNAILSQKGYQRLEDTYHPDEYRMGVYASGLEVEAISYGKAGEFNLVFECKPQRWLSVGDLPIPVDSGDILQNPTLFDSNPLIEIEGYGDFQFNGFSFSLTDEAVGYIILSDMLSSYTHQMDNINYLDNTLSFQVPKYVLATGDVFTVHGDRWTAYINLNGISGNATYTTVSNTFSATPGVTIYSESSYIVLYIQTTTTSFIYGTSKTNEAIYNVTIPTSGGNKVFKVTVLEKYNAESGEFISQLTIEGLNSAIFSSNHTTVDIDLIDSTSTFTVLGHPTYIDCDIGEAYKIEGGELVSLNNYIVMGSDLPTLQPGPNKFTFDNTITDVKVKPRWWRI